MALPAAPGSPTVPANLPVAGQSGAPGSPPPGPQSATQPTANRGMQATAMAQVQWAVRILERSLPMLGIETEPGQAVMKALSTLSKHISPGSTSPGIEQNAMQQMMMQARQDGPQQQMLRQLAAAQAGGGAGGAGGAGGGAGMMKAA